MKEKLNNLRVLIFILIFNFLGGYISSLLSGDQKLVYNSLEKPFLSPPSMTFPIVWTILYILMGISYGILASNSLKVVTEISNKS